MDSLLRNMALSVYQSQVARAISNAQAEIGGALEELRAERLGCRDFDRLCQIDYEEEDLQMTGTHIAEDDSMARDLYAQHQNLLTSRETTFSATEQLEEQLQESYQELACRVRTYTDLEELGMTSLPLTDRVRSLQKLDPEFPNASLYPTSK